MLHAAYRFYLAAPLPVPSTIITSPNKLLGCAQRCPSLLLSSQQTLPVPSTIITTNAARSFYYHATT